MSWYPEDQRVLAELRIRLAATRGRVLTERDVVSAALRMALADPAGLPLGRVE